MVLRCIVNYSADMVLLLVVLSIPFVHSRRLHGLSGTRSCLCQQYKSTLAALTSSGALWLEF
jgi:hypothetical protein